MDSIIYPDDIEIPQPSFELKWLSDEVKGLQRTGVEKLGVYYERPELLTDSLGRIWVFYRHYRNEYCRRTDFHDEKIIGHYELGWKIFGRYFDGKQWSQLYLFGQSDGGSAKTMYNQRDGQQRLSVASGADGKIGLLWTVGRTDRDMKQNSDSSTYPGEQYRGLCSVEYAEAVGQFYDTNRVNDPSDKGVMKIFDPSCILADKSRESCMVDGMEYQLFLGEMHRHTDISRCQSFYDGNMSDVYVYARDVVDLDFVATTDHELDYACADINSQVWWRYYKNTINNAVPDTFFILIGFERSAVGHHYNVISLEGVETKMPMPSRDYARYVQDDINLNGSKRALLIPHESDDGCFVGSEDDSRMDSARRLLEVYQGCRADKTGKAELIVAALQNNNNLRHFGIVASSDHHSTFASFTGVWVSEDSSDTDVISRDDIFTALFDRRTFAATDKTALIFKAGNVWMGNEIVDCDQIPEFQVRIKPSVDITGLVNPIIEVYTDKNIQNNTTVSEPVMRSTDFVVENGWLCLDIVLSEEDFSKLQDHWIFVTYSEGLLDEAGGKNSRAWSSPIWFKLKQ